MMGATAGLHSWLSMALKTMALSLRNRCLPTTHSLSSWGHCCFTWAGIRCHSILAEILQKNGEMIRQKTFVKKKKKRKKKPVYNFYNFKLDVDPRRDENASPMSSSRCMLRPTCMFMDRMIAPINVHSISKKLFTKHDSRNFFPWHQRDKN